jgi:hypothetical protein
VFDPYAWDAIDWDDADDEEGNLAHCMRHGVDELVVEEVLQEQPVEIKLSPVYAEFVIAGPDGGWTDHWTLLFDRSRKRGDWLRPVTGWKSKVAEIRKWEAATGKSWRG